MSLSNYHISSFSFSSSSSLIIAVILFLCTETTLSQNNYTLFRNAVCDETYENYSDCSCYLSYWTTEDSASPVTSEIQEECWNDFNCYYDFANEEFCSGHGECDFINTECICDQEYGDSDCSVKYVHYPLSAWMTSGMIVFSGILLLWSLGLMLWVHLYRDVGDVKAMSVVFTHLTLVGCASISAGAIAMGLGYNEANCMILEWFQFLGICMVMSCALLKAYRIASIFSSTNFSPSDLTDTVLLKYFAIMMSVDVLFLVIYTIFNFVEGGSYERYLAGPPPLYKEVRCSAEPLTMLSYSLLVAWQLVLLLFVLKYGNATRSAAKIFKETKCIYVGSNIGTIMFIAFGIFILFTTDYTLQIIIRGYGSLSVVLMVTLLMFWPKFKAVYKLHQEKKSSKDGKGPGNAEKEEERKLRHQYEANLKDPNGKELLLLLDALVRELAYRADMKMLSIELKDIDLMRCLKLLDDVRGLVPQPLQEQYDKDKKEEYKKQELNSDDSAPNVSRNNSQQPLKATIPDANRQNSKYSEMISDTATQNNNVELQVLDDDKNKKSDDDGGDYDTAAHADDDAP